GREAGGVLDYLAVHVEDVESAIGAVCELHGAEPVVARREELAFFVDADAFEHAVFDDQLFAMHEVAADVADYYPFAVGLGKGRASNCCRAGCAGEVAGGAASALD